MIRNLKPYPTYKDSGVPGLGEVPRHWEVKRLKYWLELNQLVLPENTDLDYTFDYLDIGTVGTGILASAPQKIRFETSPSRARRVVRSGDTIISTVRTYLKAVWHAEDLDTDLVASTGFAVLTPIVGTCPKFVSYLCQSDPFTNRVTAKSVGIAYPSIAETRLRTFEVCLPPIFEQTAIVSLLDYADRRIQRYIRDKQKLVVLLEEQKQAITHQAVMGRFDVRTGLPYPAYRTTDVDWLREIPKHWNVRRTKVLFRLRTEKSGTAHGKELLSIYTHIGVRPRKELEERGNKASTTDDYWMVKKGDLIANKLLTWMGAIGVSHYDGVTSPAYDILMPVVNLVSDYYHHLFRMRIYLQQFKQRSRGIMDMRLRLYFDQFGQIPVPVPPVDEQQAIVNFYNEVIVDTDRVIYKTHRQIELVQEYRARLIADVVTGKLDVHEAAATLPEVDPLAVEDTSNDTLNTNARSNPYGLDATLEEAEV